jgi:hypothetical protein
MSVKGRQSISWRVERGKEKLLGVKKIGIYYIHTYIYINIYEDNIMKLFKKCLKKLG